MFGSGDKFKNQKGQAASGNTPAPAHVPQNATHDAQPVVKSAGDGSKVLEGLLTKRGQKRKNWLGRYFVFSQVGGKTTMRYYGKRADAAKGATPKGEMTIIACRMSSEMKHNGASCLELENDEGKVVYCHASEPLLTGEWKEKISSMVKKTVFISWRMAESKAEVYILSKALEALGVEVVMIHELPGGNLLRAVSRGMAKADMFVIMDRNVRHHDLWADRH
jgi:hypothetical protein